MRPVGGHRAHYTRGPASRQMTVRGHQIAATSVGPPRGQRTLTARWRAPRRADKVCAVDGRGSPKAVIAEGDPFGLLAPDGIVRTMAVALAVAVIAAGVAVWVFRDQFAADNAEWQRPFFPELSSPRWLNLSGFGFGLFGILIVLGGMRLLAMALHVDSRWP